MQSPTPSGHLLLVDDDQGYLDSVQALIRGEGFDVDATTSGARALQWLKSKSYDLIVMDLNMPQVTGLDLLRSLQSDQRNTKTVIVSGESSPTTLAPLLRAGADDYLPKPCPPQQLLSSIHNLLARKRLEDENRAMAARVEESDRLHRYLVNQSPDLIYMLDAEGRFTFLNSRAQEILGCELQELVGSHWTSIFDDADVLIANRHFNERRAGSRTTRDFEVRARTIRSKDRPTPEQRFLEITAMGIWRPAAGSTSEFAGTYGVARDVTERRRTANQLAESQQKFYELFQSSPDPLFISRLSDGAIVDANDGFRAAYANLAGTEASNGLLTTDQRIWNNARRRRAFANRLQGSDARLHQELSVHGQGQFKHLELAARHVRVDGEDCMLASLRDLTQQRRAENERLQLESQLQKARKLEAIGHLAGGIAHDFNNILASMIGYAELALLSDSVEEEQRRSYLEQVVAAGKRARDLIAQLLSFSRTNRERAEDIDPTSELRQTLRMLRSVIPTTIDIDEGGIDEHMPAMFIDPVHLQQVLINLFVNARDAITGTGRISIAANCQVHAGACTGCQAHFSSRWIAISIEDSGMGIAQELLPRIFDRFVTSRKSGQGSGIGLSVVNSIVHDYDGHLMVESQLGRGSKFTILLPPSDRPAKLANIGANALPRPQRAGNGRILVVDDEVSVGNYIAEALRSVGYDVALYHDPSSALEHIHSAGETLDLIITDQTMPRMSGLELAGRTRVMLPATPILLVTGYQDPIRARNVGVELVDRMLLKPFSVNELFETARELIRLRMEQKNAAVGAPESESSVVWGPSAR